MVTQEEDFVIERIFGEDGQIIGAVEYNGIVDQFTVWSVHSGRGSEPFFNEAEAREWVLAQHREHQARRARALKH